MENAPRQVSAGQVIGQWFNNGILKHNGVNESNPIDGKQVLDLDQRGVVTQPTSVAKTSPFSIEQPMLIPGKSEAPGYQSYNILREVIDDVVQEKFREQRVSIENILAQQACLFENVLSNQFKLHTVHSQRHFDRLYEVCSAQPSRQFGPSSRQLGKGTNPRNFENEGDNEQAEFAAARRSIKVRAAIASSLGNMGPERSVGSKDRLLQSDVNRNESLERYQAMDSIGLDTSIGGSVPFRSDSAPISPRSDTGRPRLSVRSNRSVRNVGIEREREILHQQVHLFRAAERVCALPTVIVQNFLKRFGIGAECLGSSAAKQLDFSSRRLVKLIDSNKFATFCMMIIIVNSVWIGYLADRQLEFRLKGQDPPHWYRVVNRVFLVLFCVEITLRILALRQFFLVRYDSGWNVYDLCVVLFSLLEEIVEVMNVQYLRALRLLRLVRVVRIIRVLRFFVGLRQIIISLIDCLWIVMWVLLCMGFIMYLFAIVFVQAVAQADNPQDIQGLQKHFGSVMTSMYTLVLATSGGLMWEGLADELDQIERTYKVVIAMYIVIMIYGFLHVVNGVYVEKVFTARDHDRDLAIHHEMNKSHSFVTEMKGLLRDYGVKDRDTMDWELFQENMARTEVQMYMQTHGIDASEASQLFKLLDQNEAGVVSTDEFVYGCQRLKGVAKGMDIVLMYEKIDQLKDRLSEMKEHVDSSTRAMVGRMNEVMQETRETRIDVLCVQDCIEGDAQAQAHSRKSLL